MTNDKLLEELRKEIANLRDEVRQAGGIRYVPQPYYVPWYPWSQPYYVQPNHLTWTNTPLNTGGITYTIANNNATATIATTWLSSGSVSSTV